jgi:hypothetical protein
MPVEREELEAAARHIKLMLFGSIHSDLGFVGIGSSVIHVYVHSTKKAWANKHVATWEGFDVIWHYKVGPSVAGLAELRQ